MQPPLPKVHPCLKTGVAKVDVICKHVGKLSVIWVSARYVKRSFLDHQLLENPDSTLNC